MWIISSGVEIKKKDKYIKFEQLPIWFIFPKLATEETMKLKPRWGVTKAESEGSEEGSYGRHPGLR